MFLAEIAYCTIAMISPNLITKTILEYKLSLFESNKAKNAQLSIKFHHTMDMALLKTV